MGLLNDDGRRAVCWTQESSFPKPFEASSASPKSDAGRRRKPALARPARFAQHPTIGSLHMRDAVRRARDSVGREGGLLVPARETSGREVRSLSESER